MSGDELNPAAVAQPVEDVQGDGRWMSQVGGVYYYCRNNFTVLLYSLFILIHYLKTPDSLCMQNECTLLAGRFTLFLKGFVLFRGFSMLLHYINKISFK